MKRILIFSIILLHFLGASSQNLTGTRIYINPGHGGFDSDDRNIPVAPYTTGDRNGFWESQSNLDKGLALRTLLSAAGATVSISRTTNTTADDLPLSQIVTMANTAQADFFLSIHSNAGNGDASYVLMIHYGSDLSDTQVYANYNPNNSAQLALSNKSREISTEIAKNLYANQITTWSSGYQVRGDKTFARTIMGWSDGYGVLRGLSVPGVISEGTMHDYIPETYRLMNADYKWLETWNFYKSFCNYFKAGQIPSGVIAGQVRDSRIKNEASYYKFAGNDQMLPLNGAKLTLIETSEVYTVDNLQNGVFVFKNLVPGVYHVKAEKDGYYAQTIEVTVTAGNIANMNFKLNRVRNTPPQVVAYEPNVAITDSVNASASISLSFNWDMDAASTESAFSISPAVAGKFSWEDTNYRMRFTPDKPLEKNTVYTVKLAKTASHPDNMSMTSDFSFQFLTKSRNRLALISVYPTDGNKGVYYINPSFRLIFDKRLNTTNLATTIKVVDENNAVIAKTARSVVNNSVIAPYGSSYFNLTQNLTAGKEYTLVIDGEVMDEDGLKVSEPINIKFKAANVPVTTQQVIQTFETNVIAYEPTGSVNVSSATSALSSTKLFDAASNQLTVKFSQTTGNANFVFSTPVTLTNEKVIGMHLNGDLSGAKVELVFKSGENVFNVKLCDLNFYGWEFHEAVLSALPSDRYYKLTGINISRQNSFLFTADMNVLIDNMLVYDMSLLAVKNVNTSGMLAFPNPTTGNVSIKGAEKNHSVIQLYTLNGVMIREVNDNQMFVGDFANGTYLIKVKSNDLNFAQPLIITK